MLGLQSVLFFDRGGPVILAKRLKQYREGMGISQQKLADLMGVHVNSIKQYEQGRSQPSAEMLKKLAITFNTSADALLFEEKERQLDDDLTRLLEAILKLPENEQFIIREVLESLIIKYLLRQLDSSRK